MTYVQGLILSLQRIQCNAARQTKIDNIKLIVAVCVWKVIAEPCWNQIRLHALNCLCLSGLDFFSSFFALKREKKCEAKWTRRDAPIRRRIRLKWENERLKELAKTSTLRRNFWNVTFAWKWFRSTLLYVQHIYGVQWQWHILLSAIVHIKIAELTLMKQFPRRVAAHSNSTKSSSHPRYFVRFYWIGNRHKPACVYV